MGQSIMIPPPIQIIGSKSNAIIDLGLDGRIFSRCLYTMDGVDELINIGDVAAFELDTFTITARVKRGSIGSTQRIFSNQMQVDGADGLSGVTLTFLADNKIHCVFVIANSFELVSTTLTYSSIINEYCIAFKKVGTAVTIYVDGVIAGVGTLSSAIIDYTTSVSKKTDIGSIWNSSTAAYSGFLNGTIRDVRVYNVALSDADVLLVKNWSYAPSGMIANWIGQDATDTFGGGNWTVVDSVSANNGTSINMEEGDRTC